MTDLEKLFRATSSMRRGGADPEFARIRQESVGAVSDSGEPTAGRVNHAGDLRRLVDGSDRPLPGRTPSPRSTAGAATIEERPLGARTLSELAGPPGLQANDGAGWAAPELARAGRRPLLRRNASAGVFNFLSVLAALTAILVLVAVVSLAVLQRATANPADDAMVSLREREAELANDTKVLETAVSLAAASLADASTLTSSSAPVLEGLRGRVPDEAIAPADSARIALEQVVATAPAVEVPVYRRQVIDEKSLPQVARAIDEVQGFRQSLPPLLAQARDARSRVTEGVSTFRVALESLGSAIEAEASRIVDGNPSVRGSFRTAIADAAARVRTAQQSGGDGLAEMAAYASAVDALRSENLRILGVEDQSSLPSSRGSARVPSRSSSGGAAAPEPSASPAPDTQSPTQVNPGVQPIPTSPATPVLPGDLPTEPSSPG